MLFTTRIFWSESITNNSSFLSLISLSFSFLPRLKPRSNFDVHKKEPEEASIKIKDIIKSSKDIIAIIGPCINQENFEVDEIFKKKFIIKNSNYEIFFKKNIENNRIYFDMRGLIDKQLRESSINNIFHINKDTYTEESLFFSHRRTTKRSTQLTGRMINIIGFKQ